MLEYQKHQELQLRSQKMQESYEEKLRELEAVGQRALEDLTHRYESRLQEKDALLAQVRVGGSRSWVRLSRL